MNQSQSIRSSSKWLVSTDLINQAMQFAFGIALARLLVPADFGMIITIQIFTGFVGLVASGGMGQALIRAKELSEKDYQVIFSIQLATGLLIYTGFFIVAPWFADWFANPLYKDLLRVSAISFLIRPFLNIHNTWLQREMRFRETSKRSLFSGLISGTASVLMAMGGYGVWSLLLGGLIGSVFGYLMIFRLTPLHICLHYDHHVVKKHGEYGVKFILNELASYLRRQTSNFIITKMAGTSMVGLFNKSDSLSKLPLSTVSAPIYQPIFRAMSIEQDNPDRIKYLFLKTASLLMLYTLPLYVGLWWLAKPFIVVVYGPHWEQAAPPLQILAPLGLLYCIGHPAGAVLAATNRLGQEAIIQIVTWIIVALGCYLALHNGFGLTGVAYTIVLSQLYSTTHMFIIASRCLNTKLRELLAAFTPPILLNGILVAVLITLGHFMPANMREDSTTYYLIICTMLGALTYILSFLYLPLPSLTPEVSRWKKILRLAPDHA